MHDPECFVTLQLIIVRREKRAPTSLYTHPPKTHESPKYTCAASAYSLTKSRFITYEKWIELRSVCANSLEARGLARMDANEF